VKIKSIDPISCGKIVGILYTLAGLVIGAIVALIAILGFSIGSSVGEGGGGMFGLLFGAGAIVFFPLLYGILGFIGGLLAAVFYNLAANFVGPLEIGTE